MRRNESAAVWAMKHLEPGIVIGMTAGVASSLLFLLNVPILLSFGLGLALVVILKNEVNARLR